MTSLVLGSVERRRTVRSKWKPLIRIDVGPARNGQPERLIDLGPKQSGRRMSDSHSCRYADLCPSGATKDDSDVTIADRPKATTIARLCQSKWLLRARSRSGDRTHCYSFLILSGTRAACTSLFGLQPSPRVAHTLPGWKVEFFLIE